MLHRYHNLCSCQRRTRSLWTTAVLLTLCAYPSATAAAMQGCHPEDSDLVCKLRSVVTLLDGIAIVLALVLIVAVLAAVRAYRRKSQKLTSENISSNDR